MRRPKTLLAAIRPEPRLHPFEFLLAAEQWPQHVGRVAGDLQANRPLRAASNQDVEGGHADLIQRALQHWLVAAQLIESDHFTPHAGAVRAEGLVGADL